MFKLNNKGSIRELEMVLLVGVCERVRACLRACMHAHMYVYLHACLHASMCVYVFVCEHTCVYVNKVVFVNIVAD